MQTLFKLKYCQPLNQCIPPLISLPLLLVELFWFRLRFRPKMESQHLYSELWKTLDVPLLIEDASEGRGSAHPHVLITPPPPSLLASAAPHREPGQLISVRKTQQASVWLWYCERTFPAPASLRSCRFHDELSHRSNKPSSTAFGLSGRGCIKILYSCGRQEQECSGKIEGIRVEVVT